MIKKDDTWMAYCLSIGVKCHPQKLKKKKKKEITSNE
jgi:hypothetical protein